MLGSVLSLLMAQEGPRTAGVPSHTGLSEASPRGWTDKCGDTALTRPHTHSLSNPPGPRFPARPGSGGQRARPRGRRVPRHRPPSPPCRAPGHAPSQLPALPPGFRPHPGRTKSRRARTHRSRPAQSRGQQSSPAQRQEPRASGFPGDPPAAHVHAAARGLRQSPRPAPPTGVLGRTRGAPL